MALSQQQQQQQQHHQQFFTTGVTGGGNVFGGFGDFIVYSLILTIVVATLVYMSFNIFFGLEFRKRGKKIAKLQKKNKFEQLSNVLLMNQAYVDTGLNNKVVAMSNEINELKGTIQTLKGNNECSNYNVIKIKNPKNDNPTIAAQKVDNPIIAAPKVDSQAFLKLIPISNFTPHIDKPINNSVTESEFNKSVGTILESVGKLVCLKETLEKYVNNKKVDTPIIPPTNNPNAESKPQVEQPCAERPIERSCVGQPKVEQPQGEPKVEQPQVERPIEQPKVEQK